MMIAAAAAAGLIIAALAVLYLIVLPTSAPQKLAISASSSASSSPVSSEQAAGSWTVAKNSVAGYRVREQLAFVGAPSDAVGRTSSITGNMTLAQTPTGYTVGTATFTVDVSTLTSDRSMRDQHPRHRTAERSLSDCDLQADQPDHFARDCRQRPDGAGLRDRRPDDSRQHPERHHPAASEAEWLADRGGRVDHVPLQPVRHDTAQHRRIRKRPEQCDDGVPAVFPAGLG